MIIIMFEELATTPAKAAQRLLGCELERKINNKNIRVRIVEVEAYDQDDPASHTYRGKTPRNEVMFGPAGFLYVYFTYGMHYCCNVVTGIDGRGQGTLIRAAEPVSGEKYMELLRGKSGKLLTNGPGKLCQAMGIDLEMNGHDLSKEPFQLIMNDPLPKSVYTSSTRIGTKKAPDTLWRFYVKDNLYVSRNHGRANTT